MRRSLFCYIVVFFVMLLHVSDKNALAETILESQQTASTYFNKAKKLAMAAGANQQLSARLFDKAYQQNPKIAFQVAGVYEYILKQPSESIIWYHRSLQSEKSSKNKAIIKTTLGKKMIQHSQMILNSSVENEITLTHALAWQYAGSHHLKQHPELDKYFRKLTLAEITRASLISETILINPAPILRKVEPKAWTN